MNKEGKSNGIARERDSSLNMEWVSIKEGDAYLDLQTRIRVIIEKGKPTEGMIPEGALDPTERAKKFAADLISIIGDDMTPRLMNALVEQLAEQLAMRLLAWQSQKGHSDKPGTKLLQTFLEVDDRELSTAAPNVTQLMKPEPNLGLPTLMVGATIDFPFHKLKVVALEFKRERGFDDAVAQVVVESGLPENSKPGSHINTPWGMVQVVAAPRRKLVR